MRIGGGNEYKRLVLSRAACLIALGAVSACARAGTIGSGLIGYWPFDGSGADSSGGGYNLTLTGGATYAPGLFGQALSLQGIQGQSAVGSGDNPAFNFGSNNFSVQVWADFSAIPGEQTLIEKFSGCCGPGWTFTTPGGTDLQFYSSAGIVNAPVSLQTGVWEQFVATRNGSTLDLYFDGALIGGGSLSGAMTASTNPLLVGARNSADSRNFTVDGLIDEVGIWDRPLSGAEVSALWDGGAGEPIAPEPSSLVLTGAAMLGVMVVRWRRGRRG